MKTVDVLIKAKALIKNPKHWTKRALARDKHHHSLASPTDPRAVRWCMLGAVEKVLGVSLGDVEEQAALNRLNQALPKGVINFLEINDAGTHEQVMTVFDIAIAEERVKK